MPLIGIALKDTFWLFGRPLCRVEVAGVVIGKHPKEQFTDLYVDDGSATIRCSVYHNAALGEVVEEVQLGAFVVVQGKISCYLHQRKISVFHIRIEEDPNAETLHYLQAMHLKKEVYSKTAATTAATTTNSAASVRVPAK
ncbi:hypothetical protein QOT17_005720 [Balamuthia mandrillaris]